MTPLRGSIARTVARALSPIAIPITYKEVTQVPVDEAQPWLGMTERVVRHACRGWVESFSRFEVTRSLVEATDRKVVVLADTLAVQPSETGRVVVDGESLSIASVRSDPARATWGIQARA